MPLPQLGWADLDGNRLLAEQLAYNNAQERQIAEERIPSLNAEQRAAFDTIVDAIMNNHPKVFFLNGPAGTGKTFCYNTICSYL